MKINGNLLNLQTHRKIAKVGMSATLASVCVSALFMKNKTMRNIHVVSGWAFVGFALYHAGLYENGVFKNMIINANKKRAEQNKNGVLKNASKRQ